jgi:PTS system fructose-specific IIA component
MKISQVLTPGHVIPSMASKNRWESIEELLGPLVADGTITKEKRQSALDSLLAREKQMSTGIGFGVAIPHAPTDAVSKVSMSVGLSAGGIQFDALDGKPVHIVVLFVVPAAEYQAHLKTLAAISKLLNQKTFRKELEKARSAEEIYKAFTSRDK